MPCWSDLIIEISSAKKLFEKVVIDPYLGLKIGLFKMLLGKTVDTKTPTVFSTLSPGQDRHKAQKVMARKPGDIRTQMA